MNIQKHTLQRTPKEQIVVNNKQNYPQQIAINKKNKTKSHLFLTTFLFAPNSFYCYNRNNKIQRKNKNKQTNKQTNKQKTTTTKVWIIVWPNKKFGPFDIFWDDLNRVYMNKPCMCVYACGYPRKTLCPMFYFFPPMFLFFSFFLILLLLYYSYTFPPRYSTFHGRVLLRCVVFSWTMLTWIYFLAKRRVWALTQTSLPHILFGRMCEIGFGFIIIFLSY